MDMLLYVIVALLIANLLIAGRLLLRKKGSGNSWSNEAARIEQSLRYEISLNREEVRKSLQANREETGSSFKNLSETTINTLAEIASIQKKQLDDFSAQLQLLIKTNEEKTEKLIAKHSEMNASLDVRFEKIRETIRQSLQHLQEENAKKLEEMRVVVDEKLQSSVEKRFNESFKLISERLEQVHKGLGEMQSLASGVGDLKKALTNVKTRGTLGEIQLGVILEQFLSPEQYEANAAVKKNSQERVEFAVKLPSKFNDGSFVLLPVDSKFPVENYHRLSEALDNPARFDPQALESIARQFESAVRKNAGNIRDKYINPPVTTDFAIMFVPTEGLYAEILRRPSLFETLQREYKITVVGPSNLVAFLSSLQMGFRTLAIEKRSSEVWEVLGAVKAEFGNFGIILDKTKKKLQEATNVIDRAGVRTRAIERKLRTVEDLPPEQSSHVLGDAFSIEEEEEKE